MPPIGPIRRQNLISGLRRLGFDGPYSAKKHQFMHRADITVTIPNPHGSDIGVQLLTRILRQAGVSRDDWERL